MTALRQVNNTTWVNPDAIAVLVNNGNGTWNVTMIGGTPAYTNVPDRIIFTVFPELTPPPPLAMQPQQGSPPT